MRRILASAALAALLGGAAAGGLLYAFQSALPAGRSLPGTVVGEAIQPADVGGGDWLEAERQKLAAAHAYVELPDEWLEISRADAGFDLDVGATLRAVLEHARHGSIWERFQRSRRAAQGLERVELVWRFDRERARRTVLALADRARVEPVNARLDLEGYQRVEHLTGRTLDIEATLERWATLEDPSGTLVLDVVTHPVPPEVTSDMIEAIDPSKVLARFETSFKGKAGARAINIRKAASFLSGTILAPGQVLSFNKAVGLRTEERGFVDAPVIVNDELEPGVGGGVCQVATTVHGAAVYAGLEIVRRRSHSRPSGYAPLGLDATVIDEKVDLRIKNPFDQPVILQIVFPSRYTIRAELLGMEPEGKVEHHYEVKAKSPFYRRVVVKPELTPGTFELKQEGIFGYDVQSVVRVTRADGSKSHRTYPSKYYPVPEVYWVAPGVDPSALPPLPEGAERVEIGEPDIDLDLTAFEREGPQLAPARHMPGGRVNGVSEDGAVRDVN